LTINVSPVILSAAKDLLYWALRSFAALRMTGPMVVVEIRHRREAEADRTRIRADESAMSMVNRLLQVWFFMHPNDGEHYKAAFNCLRKMVLSY